MAYELKWIETTAPGRVATMPRPTGWGALEDDLRELQSQGAHVIVSLLMPDDVRMAGLEEEAVLCESIGLGFYQYPISDRGLPECPLQIRELADTLVDELQQGRNIALHCFAGIGRATIMGAATLIRLGMTAEEAIAAIARTRGFIVPDTPIQYGWIEDFAREHSL